MKFIQSSNLLKSSVSAMALSAFVLTGTTVARAEDGDSPSSGAASAAFGDTVVVTARKKAGAEDVQVVPLAVSAYGEEQLEAMQYRSLFDLQQRLPNVSMEEASTVPGVANFAIRGLGVNSSRAEATPTVGVFVDGVYYGVNYGVLTDMFDVESVQVLRGPQGLLFGRNVTGGAILINNKKPTDEFELTTKAGIESGPLYSAAGAISGPLTEGVSARLTGYYAKDKGWFFNEYDQEPHGLRESFIIRPQIRIQPSEALDLNLSYEHGETNGDGAASGNPGIYGRDSFQFSNDLQTFSDTEWDKAVSEFNWDVGFGDGAITNITSWRKLMQEATIDIDSTSNAGRHSYVGLDAEQFSSELRYAGSFSDLVDVTIGAFYFKQDLAYQQNTYAGFSNSSSYIGGLQNEWSVAVFSAFDIHLTDKLTLNTGIRYDYEEKEVQIATLLPSTSVAGVTDIVNVPAGQCDVLMGSCNFDFIDKADWNSVTPKVGLEYQPSDEILLYGFWTKGFRSGGYNLRSTSLTVPPGPYDQESQNSFEIGAKTTFLDSLRWNTAAFLNKVNDLQRTSLDTTMGVVQVVQNVADATIWGVESNVDFMVMPNLTLNAAVGYTHGKQTTVLADLSGDGVIDDADYALELPRLTPWTYSAGFVYDRDLGNLGTASLNFNYNFHDKSFYTDNNRGYLNSMRVLNANLSLETLDGHVVLSVYGKNMLNEVNFGVHAPLRNGIDEFAPLNKGRIVGFSATYNH